MKIYHLIVLFIFTACQEKMNTETSPPTCEKKPKLLSIHNDDRLDDYYWLKDRENPSVINYLKKENSYTKSIMANTDTLQNNLFKELKGRIKEEDKSVPYTYNGFSYWRKYKTGAEHPIYYRENNNTKSKEVLIDCNKLAKDYDFFDFSTYDISSNNELMAYGYDTLSRRIYQIKIKNITTGEVYPEILENTTGSMVWANDNKTIFYTKQDLQTLRSFQIYSHTIGTNQSEDILIYEEKDETFYCYVYKSKSDQFIIINSSSTLSDEYKLIPAEKPLTKPKTFQVRKKGLEYSIYHFYDKFYIITNQDHKNFSIKECSINETNSEVWSTFIEGDDECLIEGIDLFDNYMVITERREGLLQLKVINLKDNKSWYIPFNESTYIANTTSNLEMQSNTLRFAYNSMVNPGTVYDYNMDAKTTKILKEKEIVGGYNQNDYHSERLWADSRDGTKIPLSIVYKKGLERNGKNPTLLYAYGSYGYSIDPTFSSNRLSLLDRGFIFVIAHIRGGEEMGRQWYESGKLLKKKNTFFDFIDCGEFLIQEKFCTKENLYAAGGSAGGLLVGAVINLAPNLFNGVIAHVPFVDVVTTMLDESIPLTTGEYDEWGNPNNKEYYDYMLSYSPYDNVEEKEYPNLLVTTGLHDSQVQYWEPAKWVAKLREKKTDDNILLLKTNMKTGHGGASGRFEYLKEIAFDYAFLFKLENITD
jgi:oligopeptidase B